MRLRGVLRDLVRALRVPANAAAFDAAHAGQEVHADLRGDVRRHA